MGCCHDSTNHTRHFQGFLNPELPNNRVNTTKYSILTFLPKAIIIQFLRPANLVYLISAVLQSIPVISSLTPVTAIAPFISVLAISLIRQGYEDYKRHLTDEQINRRQTQRLANQQFVSVQWQDLLVGDIVRVCNGEIIPADILILHTSEQNSLCYVATADLDGETNLKTKYAQVEITKLYPHMYEIIRGDIIVDTPNYDLHSFEGMVRMETKQEINIDFENVILRETVLKNTDEVVGVVIYTGHHTKILQNQGPIEHKVSNVERRVNIIQFILLIILFLLATTCCLGFWYYHTVQNKRSDLYYLRSQVQNQQVQSVFIFFSSFLLLTFIIPISLNLTIEVIKVFLGIFLSFDNKMYYEPIDKKCDVNNVSILEELGTIDYVLTDKTGTLTANEMVFKHLLIEQGSYSAYQIQRNLDSLRRDENFHKFWVGLVICHDVVFDPETQHYEGSSPDEVCFVEFAKRIGYRFVKRTKNSIELEISGEKVVYELLEIVGFDSRKRMSVIVKDLNLGQIICYTKGADSAIFRKSVPAATKHEIIKKGINDFAKEGYRTLLFGYRIINNQEYQILQQERQTIRQAKLQKTKTKIQIECSQQSLVQKIENNLIILGATAIEDRLQDEVPRTIQRLQDTGIVVMMITGDKLQTAQNIGYLANFIKHEAKLVKLEDGISNQTMIAALQDVEHEQSLKNSHQLFSLIIEGSTINKFLTLQHEITKKALLTVSSVIFCRSTPKEKASIVSFVKDKLKGIVLAIGDGGNDVGMIQVANVGVGILGKEGNSASVVSDFSIGQFKLLDRLLLHHGRWFYYRLSYFFVYYGWKNLMMTLILYFFMMDSAFSALPSLAQPFIAVYNIMIGLSTVVYYSTFEQDINDDQLEQAWYKLPSFYKQTKQRDLFSYRRYFSWTVFSIVIAALIFCSIKFSIGATDSINELGNTPDLSHQSQAQALSLTLIVIIVLVMDIRMYTVYSTGFVLGFTTFLGAIVFFIGENYFNGFRNYHVFSTTTFRFWLVVFLNMGIVYACKATYDMIYFLLYPTEIDKTIKMIKKAQKYK